MRSFNLLAITFAFFILQINLNAEYIVSDLSDLPDDDLTDGIFEPHTLRSAIQNANHDGTGTSIKIFPDNSTIQLTSDLPVINVPINFDGKGLILEPASGSLAKFGLWITSNNSVVRNVLIQGFSNTGLVWQGSDGLIEMIVSRNNGINLNMNHAHRNTIGGKLSGYYSNYFYGASGSSGQGISLVGTWADSVEGGNNDNIIQYCAIGIDEQGNAKPNRKGINISMSKRNIIKYNLISGNDEEGVMIDGTIPGKDGEGKSIWLASYLDTQIENNSIGINNQGGNAIPNNIGIEIKGSMSDVISNNTISGNSGEGIFIADALCKLITIDSNKIGTDRFGTRAVGNGTGIRLNGSENIVRNNIVSGNKYDGISVSSPFSIIQSNIVGLDAEQKNALPNGYSGILVWCSNIVIGDTVGVYFNVVAGNKKNGINIIGANEKNIFISNNFIGTNSDTSKTFQNEGSGIKLTYSLNEVFIENNIIASNGEHGIRIERNVVIFLDTTQPHFYQKPFNIEIAKNLIKGPFGGSGVSIFNADSIYIYENTIEGTKENGISIENDSTRYIVIINNQIGPKNNKQSEQIISGDGIFVKDAKSVFIGGKLSEKESNTIINCNGSGVLTIDADSIYIYGNFISGIKENGISIKGLLSEFITIRQNQIGPEKDTLDANNIKGDGIYVEDAIDVLIGSQLIPSDSNNIMFCDGYGVSVQKKAKEVYIFGNSMIENKKGGISLDDVELYFAFGFSDDTLDADLGSNGLQNTPVMELADAVGDLIRIKGRFRGFANTTYRIDAYLAKKLADDIQFKTQGSIYLDWFTIKTDDDGFAKIDTSWSNEKIATFSTDYPFVTLTASGVEGTSCFSIIGNPDVYVDVEIKIDTSRTFVDNNGNITLVALIKNNGTDIVTTVSVRDTVSSFELKNVTISKGTAIISDSTFVATIPSLGSGETVEYSAYGKSKVIGEHKRRILAIPSENDINPLNNADTVSLNVPFVNSIKNGNIIKLEISLIRENKARITGHGGGGITVRLYDLLGQLYDESKYSVLPEQAIEIDLNKRITLVEVIHDKQKIISKLICTW
ncbi:MAG: right-handed parallel beta-helix repeat-containing protein [Ignavibacteriae bacterium]|nr:right-handed parallel beta-helix repeat-containing protein [Ignavibacteriota bacterium]